MVSERATILNNITLLVKWKNAIDKGKVFGALLTDLSKAFDCLNHELLISKLNAYGFTLPALKLVHNYLLDKKQRTRVNNSYSAWFEIRFGVPEGSILRPLLFNTFLADLFFILNKIDIANYLDDNTPYTSSNDVNGLTKSLEEASKELFKWFGDNLLKSNPDNKLSFDYHLSEIRKTASRKLYALDRVTLYMNLSKRKILMNAFFNLQFSYCPLVWMCHSRIINKKIKRHYLRDV